MKNNCVLCALLLFLFTSWLYSDQNPSSGAAVGAGSGGPKTKPAGQGARILIMAPEYRKDEGLIRDRNAEAHLYDVILEPRTFEEALDQIRKFGKHRKIKNLTFLGHGDVAGGIMDFGGVDVNSSMLEITRTKARKDGDTELLDAFDDNAEIVFYECYAGMDPAFGANAAALFLCFSGGTVYASPEAVSSPTSGANRALEILRLVRLAGPKDYSHDSASAVDYHQFNSNTVSAFSLRDMEQVRITTEGPDTARLKEPVVLKAVLPDSLMRRKDVKPYVSLFWYREVNGKKQKLGNTDSIQPDTSQSGLQTIRLELRVGNGCGEKVIGKATHLLMVEEELPLAIDLSGNGECGEDITAKARLVKGVLPEGALWRWIGTGGVKPLAKGGESVDVEVSSDGELELQLMRIGDFGKVHQLGSTRVPIKSAGKRIEPIFCATAPNNWEGVGTEKGVTFTRKIAKVKGPCGWDASVTAGISAEYSGLGDIKTKEDAVARAQEDFKARRQGDMPNDPAVGLFMAGGIEGASPMKIGGFEGAIADFAIWVRRGSWGSGYTGSGLGANGRGTVVNKCGAIRFSYSVHGGGCWDNSDNDYLFAQAAAAQKEAKAILASLSLCKEAQIRKEPYAGPAYDDVKVKPQQDRQPEQAGGEEPQKESISHPAGSNESSAANDKQKAHPSGTPRTLFSNGNVGGVRNDAHCYPVFTLERPAKVTLVETYHWNGGRGARGGTITVRGSDGAIYGPWKVRTYAGQGGAPDVYWRAAPDIVLPAGTYTVVDSDTATWSNNEQSSGCGFTRVDGI